MTRHEKKLWYEFLRYKKPPFYKQRPIDCYIVDFYHPASKLVIELDGSHHLTEAGLESDKDRDMNLKGYGLTIMRFTNDEIESNFDVVCQKILNHCKHHFA